MKYIFLFSLLIFNLSQLLGQYKFTVDKEISCTSVKNQQKTGTCWSFATSSFLESELIRMGYDNVDLSEMYIVKQIYKDKALNYVLRQGKANFSEGSLSHDVIRAIEMGAIVPEKYFSGRSKANQPYNHSEMVSIMKSILDGVIENKKPSSNWQAAQEVILDVYMGTSDEKITLKDKELTPKEYTDQLPLNPDNYVSITSYSHHPFYSDFVLEIPDNYSGGSYYNLPLDEMINVLDFALLEGYTVAWDGDVSEKGFDAKKGIAILPEDPDRKDLFTRIGKELGVDQENRQEAFLNYSSTDDHLMHIVGVALDQKGNKYYITKNSWGEISPYKGYVFMSEAYVKMKTVALLLHKDGVPKVTASKLFRLR